MREKIRVQDIGLDRDEIERRKQLTRDLWAGRPVDHVPVYVTVENPQPKYTIREQFQDADKQLEEALAVVALTWKHVPEGDMVPAMRPDVGCSPLATAFGAELFWGDDPNQTCGVKDPPLANVEQAHELAVPPPDAGQLAEGTAGAPLCRGGGRAHQRLAVGHGRRAERGRRSAGLQPVV